MSTPYVRHRDYYRAYHKRYRQTHPGYREHQNQLKRQAYRENKKEHLHRAESYQASIREKWFHGKRLTSQEEELAIAAKRLAIERILPKEGFQSLLWPGYINQLDEATGGFWVFDAFAYREGQPYALSVTISPKKKIRQRALVAAFLKFFGITLCVCCVKPDLTKYYLNEFDADHVPAAITMTLARLRQLKSV